MFWYSYLYIKWVLLVLFSFIKKFSYIATKIITSIILKDTQFYTLGYILYINTKKAWN